MSLTPEQLTEFVIDLAARPAQWADHVRHDPQARVYELIHEDEEVNAWLICWSEDQDTGFHDHDISAAAIHVIEGQVREDRLRLNGSPLERVACPGTTLVLSPTAIHRVLHAGEGPAVTIHAYSPPLARTGAYRMGPQGELQRIAQSSDERLATVETN